MAKLNVGEAFLQVVASFENVHRTIAAEVAKIKDITLNVDPDTKGFREKVQAGIRGIGSMDVPVRPDIDTTRANAQIGEFATTLRAKLEAATKAIGDIRIDADASPVERKIASIRAELATLQNQRIGVDISAEAAMAKIKALEAELAALGARSPNIQVKVDVDAARANLRALMADGDSLITKFSKANLGSTMFASIGAAIPPLITSIGQLSGALGLIPGVAAGVGTALASVVVGSQGLGEAFKAQAAAQEASTAASGKNVAALQQQVTAGAAHIASLKAQQAAGKNVTAQLQAAEATQKANVAALNDAKGATDKAKEAADAYAASLTNLAPSARSFVSAIVQLKPAFNDLRLDVQQELFKGIGDKILEVANTALPTLRAGLSSMASAINIVAQRILDFIGQQSSVQSWQNIFQNVSTAAGNLASAIQPILQIITNVAEVGSQFLPELARHFAEAAQRASDFVAHAKETGQLKQWIQTGIDAVKELWGAFKDVVAIIRDLTVMPGFGPNFLEALKAVTGSIRWIIENVPGATSLVQAFFDAWLFAKVIQGLTNMIKTIKDVGTALKDGIEILKNWITKNTEAGAASEAAAARSKTAWVTAAKAIGLALAAVAFDKILPQAPSGDTNNPLVKMRQELHDLASAVEDPQAAIEDLINELSHFGDQFDFQNSPIMTFFRGLPSFFSGIWQQVSGTASGLVEGIAAQLGALPTRIQGILSGLSGVFSGAWSSISATASGLVEGIAAQIGALPARIQGLLSGLAGIFSGIWSSIAATASSLVEGIAAQIGALPARIQGLLSGLAGIFSGIWSTVSATASQLVEGIAAQIGALPARIQGLLGGLPGIVSGIFQQIVTNVAAVLGQIVQRAQQVAQQIAQAFQALPGQMAQIGSAIVQGIGQAIQAGWSWLVQTVQNLARQLFQAAKAALGIASPSRQFMWIGRNLVLGLSQGIENAQKYAEQAMAKLNEMLLSAGGSVDIQQNVSDNTMQARSAYQSAGRRHSRDDRAWAELEELLRRWRGDRGGGGTGRPPPVPTTIGTSQTQFRKMDVAFGSGAASYIKRVTVPITDVVNPAVQTPPSSGGGGRGGGGRGGRIYIDTNSAIVEEILRIVRNEVRRVGGDVQDALGPR